MSVGIENVKSKVKEWTGKDVRCVDLFCGDASVFEYIAILDSGEVYEGVVIEGDILEGRLCEKDEAKDYIRMRAALSALLELVIEICWDEEKNVIDARGKRACEDALKLLNVFGAVELKGKHIATLTDFGQSLLDGYVLDLVGGGNEKRNCTAQ